MPKSQLNLPPLPVTNRSQGPVSRTSQEPESPARTNDSEPDDITRAASFLFDAALRDARMTSAEAAHMMGANGRPLSESLVNRMRSPNYRECVSLVQLLRCGPSVTWHFHRAMHAKQKFGQLALRDAMQGLSLLAVGIE